MAKNRTSFGQPDAADPVKAGQLGKRGASPKVVVQKWLTDNPDTVQEIISQYAKRAAKGDIEAQEFLIKNGLWLQDKEDKPQAVQVPVFIVNSPVAIEKDITPQPAHIQQDDDVYPLD